MVSRRKPIPEEPPPPSSTVRPLVRRWLLQMTVSLVGVALLLGAVIVLGNFARQQLQGHQRFQVAFTDIECNPPRPLGRTEFLEEVRYHSRLPEEFSIFEDGVADRLRESFSRHPWVAKVNHVEIVPPRAVRIVLTYRQPVLAVVVTPDLAGVGFEEPLADAEKQPLRAVDEQGVLLPKKALLPRGLPILNRAPRPAAGAGQRWGEPGVVAAAQMAASLREQLERAHISALTWSNQGLVLWSNGCKVLWGHPPELSKADEASQAVKEQRLLKLFSKSQAEPPWWVFMHEYDLRPRDAMTDRLVLRDEP